MRIVYATAEIAPVAMVGGLGAASAGLVAELRRQGVEVDVVLPDYGGGVLADEHVTELDVPAWAGPARVRRGVHEVVGPLHLVDAPRIARSHPYVQPDGQGWGDNDHRFFAFSQAVAAMVRAAPPDVLHVNDWHTATTLAALDAGIPSVLSIHNLAYQGLAPDGWIGVLGPRAGAFAHGGACNPLAGAITLADGVIVVSPNYAREITTPEHGHGLDGALRDRGDTLVGILNGIDTDLWDPATDPHCPHHFDASDLSRKAAARAALRSELGLPEQKGPLFVVLSRLVEQKGIDLVVPLLRFLPTMPAQLAVLGAGDAWTTAALRAAAEEHPESVAFVEGYDEGLGHRLLSGGDLLLMPSRFEPCGLTQMQAMRYGALPVATDVGGLHDTIVDLDAQPRAGTGWLAANPDSAAVLDAMHRAVRGWSVPARRAAAQRRAMAIDWSWTVPTAQYVRLYEQVRATGTVTL